MMIKPTHAVAITDLTSVFIMEGTPCKNNRLLENHITISLHYGIRVSMLTHICDITIPDLLFTLMDTMVSLLGIRVLCKAGCKVIFDDKCQDIFNN